MIIINRLQVTKQGYREPMATTSENCTQKAIHRAPPSVSMDTIWEANKSIWKQNYAGKKTTVAEEWSENVLS